MAFLGGLDQNSTFSTVRTQQNSHPTPENDPFLIQNSPNAKNHPN